ncbi:MAG: hypothetical protein AAF354_08000, partial [Pseudomonadota bacterium]
MRLGFGFSRHCRHACGVLTVGAICVVTASGLSASDARAQAAMVDGPTGGETVVRKSIAVGAGVVIKPKYEGSQEHEAIPLPIFIPRLVEEEDTPDGIFKEVR